jgi:hypothetical protein
MGRPRHATVVAYLAPFVALSGSSYAAITITGRNIKDGSVRYRDLSTGARRLLHGATGPAGERGPAGESGPAGVAGPAGSPGESVPADGSAEEKGRRLAEALGAAKRGDIVRVHGSYELVPESLPLVVPDGVQVVGDGSEATRIATTVVEADATVVRLEQYAQLTAVQIAARRTEKRSEPDVVVLDMGEDTIARDVHVVARSHWGGTFRGVLMHGGAELRRSEVDVNLGYGSAFGITLAGGIVQDALVAAVSQGFTQGIEVTGRSRLIRVDASAAIGVHGNVALHASGSGTTVFAAGSRFDSNPTSGGTPLAVEATGGSAIRIATSELAAGSVAGDVRCVESFATDFTPLDAGCS